MEKSGTWWKAAIAVLAVVAAAAIAYNVGWNNAQAEQEVPDQLRTLLNRSDIESVELEKGPIYVFGHQTPDSDSVCSSIAYAELLQKLGYDAQPATLGPLNNETKFILEQNGVEEPQLIEDVSGCNVVLIDHAEYAQSAEGLKDANIISIIDHHGAGDVVTSDPIVYDARPLGSAATIVWIRYLNYDVEIEPQTAKLLLDALLSDTSNLQSNATTPADVEAKNALSVAAGVEDPDALYQEMYKKSISYEGMTDEEILLSDIKEYESAGKTFSIACVNAWDEETALNLTKRMKDEMPKVAPSLDVDLLFTQVSIFHDDISITYLVPLGDAEADVIKEAFGDKAEFDGTSYVLNPGCSRKQVLVPAFSDVLAAYPQE